MSRFTITILLCASVLGGCRRSSNSSDYVLSCQKHAALSECTEYTDAAAAPRRDYLRKSCDAVHGEMRDAACEREPSEIGRCELDGERRWMYSDGRISYTAASAASLCNVIEGVWISGR